VRTKPIAKRKLHEKAIYLNWNSALKRQEWSNRYPMNRYTMKNQRGLMKAITTLVAASSKPRLGSAGTVGALVKRDQIIQSQHLEIERLKKTIASCQAILSSSCQH
jgi:hypothetical protein